MSKAREILDGSEALVNLVEAIGKHRPHPEAKGKQ